MIERTKEKKYPPGPYTVSCVGFGAEQGHLWKVMNLIYDKDGESKISQISSWVTREDVEGKFPNVRETGSSGLCPLCKERYLASLEEEERELDAKTS